MLEKHPLSNKAYFFLCAEVTPFTDDKRRIASSFPATIAALKFIELDSYAFDHQIIYLCVYCLFNQIPWMEKTDLPVYYSDILGQKTNNYK